ncbi:hypothetical protein IFM12275_24960 [Nocardia sputorum]|nr:hypothetical protein IFM12275_24960 [Nocardia sputorum]
MRHCDKVTGMSDRTAATRVVGTIAVLVTVLLVSGCVRQGKPVPAHADLAALDVGYYSVEPLTEPHVAENRYGRVVESVRMAEAVIDPVEAYPSLVFGLGAVRVAPLPTPVKTSGLLSAPVQAVLQRHGMLAGFSVSGSDTEMAGSPIVGAARMLTVMLLRFPDAESAGRAAQEIDAVDAAVSAENVPIAIPEHAAAHSHWRPTVPTLAATMAHGSFVINVLAGHTTPDPAALTGLASRAFGAQVARLRDFQPTPEDRIAALPLDRDGMLRRVVPDKPGQWTFPAAIAPGSVRTAGWNAAIWPVGIVYGPRGAYLHSGRPLEGTERGQPQESLATIGHHWVARYATVAIARAEFDAHAGDLTAAGVRPAPVPAGLPDTRCGERLDGTEFAPRFRCEVLFGRYLAVVAGRTVTDAQQRAAAQYAVLLNSESE